MAIARTLPAYNGMPQVNEIEQLYLSAIAAARETIYMESQYCASATVCSALAARLREPDGPEVIVVNPLSSASWLESEVMDSARRLAVARLREADRHGRFRIYQPVNEADEPIYVHAKVLACDDRLLRVGSSNVNNRSMGFDTECDLAIEAAPGAADDDRLRAAITALRDDLLAEHLGTTPAAFAAARQAQGSFLGAIETERKRRRGRTLRPLHVQPLNGAERALAESRLFDPERPCRKEGHLKHFVKKALQPFHVQAAVAGGIVTTAVLAEIVRRAARRRSKDRP